VPRASTSRFRSSLSCWPIRPQPLRRPH